MDVTRLTDLLNERTQAAAALTGSRLARCPVCSLLVPERCLVEHARSYGDDGHRVLEVMES